MKDKGGAPYKNERQLAEEENTATYRPMVAKRNGIVVLCRTCRTKFEVADIDDSCDTCGWKP